MPAGDVHAERACLPVTLYDRMALGWTTLDALVFPGVHVQPTLPLPCARRAEEVLTRLRGKRPAWRPGRPSAAGRLSYLHTHLGGNDWHAIRLLGFQAEPLVEIETNYLRCILAFGRVVALGRSAGLSVGVTRGGAAACQRYLV